MAGTWVLLLLTNLVLESCVYGQSNKNGKGVVIVTSTPGFVETTTTDAGYADAQPEYWDYNCYDCNYYFDGDTTTEAAPITSTVAQTTTSMPKKQVPTTTSRVLKVTTTSEPLEDEIQPEYRDYGPPVGTIFKPQYYDDNGNTNYYFEETTTEAAPTTTTVAPKTTSMPKKQVPTTTSRVLKVTTTSEPLFEEIQPEVWDYGPPLGTIFKPLYYDDNGHTNDYFVQTTTTTQSPTAQSITTVQPTTALASASRFTLKTAEPQTTTTQLTITTMANPSNTATPTTSVQLTSASIAVKTTTKTVKKGVLVTGMFFVKKMYRDLLTGYDTRVRPVQNQSKPVYVNTKFVPMSLVDFDSANQKLSMMAYIRIHWVDEQMVWKPRRYAGRSGLRASLHELWTPNIVLHKVTMFYLRLYSILLKFIL